MKSKLLLFILSIFFFISCKNSKENLTTEKDRIELIPEPDKDLKLEYEKKQIQEKNTCSFLQPDTSVSGIKICNVESIIKILGKETKLGGDSTYAFYSKNKNQELKLTVHPGDVYNQVSIFKVVYSKNTKLNQPIINDISIETEKGIKLGISKSELIKKLGNCYAAKDSTNESIELYYKIEKPNDSKTNLLKTNDMPLYYASYKLKKDKLDEFEFGFEYP